MDAPDILVLREPIAPLELEPLKFWHHTLVKGVADIRRGVIALGGEWHMDANTVLIADGSEQQDMWGFNVYPREKRDKAIKYNSMINIRPLQGNRSMDLHNVELQKAIRTLVGRIIPDLELV